MSLVKKMIGQALDARRRITSEVGSLGPAQGSFRPAPQSWSVAEIVEHLVHAEHAGIEKIWEAMESHERGEPWRGELPHRGKSIEQIVEETWKSKEVAPDIAAPRIGGPLPYWVACLEGCQPVLEALGERLEGRDLEAIVFPHVLSGPLDARQRLEFLRFHMDRHRDQIERLVASPGFPQSSAGDHS